MLELILITIRPSSSKSDQYCPKDCNKSKENPRIIIKVAAAIGGFHRWRLSIVAVEESFNQGKKE
ncbi:hypothetical protein KHA80_07340 [Anaerobacillus sp. HL2]|nr:hypothetical protein KHA80_07340 [Anaerobacillus sp. HL2]